jgi:hypothetical protein
VIGESYHEVEDRLLAAIHVRFGLPRELSVACRQLCKAADRAAAHLEAIRLAGFAATEARRFFGPAPRLGAAIEKEYLTPWLALDAEARFLKRFAELTSG